MTSRDDRSVARIVSLLTTLRGPRLRQLASELADDDRAGVRQAVDAAMARERARSREDARLRKLYSLEAELRSQGYVIVAGVDEVGRGALAGPLTAGACVLPPSPRIRHLNDSKQLTPARREELAAEIRKVAVCWSIAHVPPAELDVLGMTAALRRVVREALTALTECADHVVVDGHPMRVAENETAVIGGDGRVAAIAAASILAKVTRDALMVEMSSLHPEYIFEVNKGYGTPEHLAAIDAFGLTPQHRRSFMPCGGTERLF